MRTRFRTIWISDTHLGSSGAQAEELAYLLRHVACEHLYLVGDIIDMWRLRQRWRWPEAHNTVVRRLLKLAAKGTRILYIPGNHDDAARQFAGMDFGGIRVALNAAHETADGRQLLVCHGDQYDLVVQHSRLLSVIGSTTYDMLLAVNRVWNGARRRLGLPYHSLSQAIKFKVKSACTFISRFEEELIAEAGRGGFAGVVCGHIHKAEIRMAGDVAYYNCGDWVESCSLLVEHDDGRIELLDGLAFNRAMRERLASRQAIEEPDDWPEHAMPFPLPSTPGRSKLVVAGS